MKSAQDKVNAVAASGQLGIFANGYWGHPAMHLSPEVNLLAFSHYLQALEYQRKATQVVGMLGSKSPHIQNLTVGGVTNAINLDSLATLNMKRLEEIKVLMNEVNLRPAGLFADACAIAGMYADWFNYGAGVTNYLAVPDLPLDSKTPCSIFPADTSWKAIRVVKPFKTAADPIFRDAVTKNGTCLLQR